MDQFQTPEGMYLGAKIEIREKVIGGVPMLFADVVQINDPTKRFPFSCIPSAMLEFDTTGQVHEEWLALLKKMLRWMMIEATGEAIAEFKIVPLNPDKGPR